MVSIGKIVYVEDTGYVLELNVVKAPENEYVTYLVPEFSSGVFKLLYTATKSKNTVTTVCDCHDVIANNPLPEIAGASLSVYNIDKVFYEPVAEILTLLLKGILSIYPDFEAVTYGFDKRLIAMSKLMYYNAAILLQNNIYDVGERLYKTTDYRILKLGNDSDNLIINDNDVIVNIWMEKLPGRSRVFIGEYPYNSIYFREKILNFGSNEGSELYTEFFIPIYSRNNIEIGKICCFSPISGKLELVGIPETESLEIDRSTYNDASRIVNRFVEGDVLGSINSVVQMLFNELASSINKMINGSSCTNILTELGYNSWVRILALYGIDSFINYTIEEQFKSIPDDILDKYKNFVYQYIYTMYRIISYKSTKHCDWCCKYFPTLRKKVYLHFGDMESNFSFTDDWVAVLGNNVVSAIELPFNWIVSPMKLTLNEILHQLRSDYPIQLIIGEDINPIRNATLPFPTVALKKYCVVYQYTTEEFLNEIKESCEPIVYCKHIPVSYPLYIIQDSIGWMITIQDIFNNWTRKKRVIEFSDSVNEVEVDFTGHIIGDVYSYWEEDSVDRVYFTEDKEHTNVFMFHCFIVGQENSSPVDLGGVYIPSGKSGAEKLVNELNEKYHLRSYRLIMKNECASPVAIITDICRDIVDNIISTTPDFASSICEESVHSPDSDSKVISYYMITDIDERFKQIFEYIDESLWVELQLGITEINNELSKDGGDHIYDCLILRTNPSASSAYISTSRDDQIYFSDKLEKYKYVVMLASALKYPIVIGYLTI